MGNHKNFIYKSAADHKETDIKQAFAELLTEKKSLSLITVSELSKKASITRGTFYAHYDNIYDVASDIENELVESVNLPSDNNGSLSSTDNNTSEKFDINQYFDRIFGFLKENKNLYKELFKSDIPLHFFSKFNQRIRTNLADYLHNSPSNRPTLDLDIAFYADGVSMMILHYFKNDINTDLDNIKWYLIQKYKQTFGDTDLS